jgi:hypothetical protein
MTREPWGSIVVGPDMRPSLLLHAVLRKVNTALS